MQVLRVALVVAEYYGGDVNPLGLVTLASCLTVLGVFPRCRRVGSGHEITSELAFCGLDVGSQYDTGHVTGLVDVTLTCYVSGRHVRVGGYGVRVCGQVTVILQGRQHDMLSIS